MIKIFDWLDFLEVGNALAKNPDEAFIRSAITRYYYSIFSAIREYLIYNKHQYQFIDNKNVHQRVWKFLTSSNNYNENEIGEFLGKVRHVRNYADYDKNKDYYYFKEQLNNIFRTIENVVNSLNYLRGNY